VSWGKIVYHVNHLSDIYRRIFSHILITFATELIVKINFKKTHEIWDFEFP